MKIAQVVLPGASQYERKCQRIDHALLAPDHQLLVVQELGEVTGSGAEVAHVYGPAIIPRNRFQRFHLPYVANGTPERRRLAWRRPPEPGYVVTPLPGSGGELLPEGVEEAYFAIDGPRAEARPPYTIGSIARPSVEGLVEQTMARVDRFRDDVEWRLFDRPPYPDELAALDAWVDPATADDDYDGWLAEAIVAGLPAIGTATPINLHRTERNRAAFLVPKSDPNELTHAILAALFKPEVARMKIEAARQTQSKYRPRQRLRILTAMYENLTRK